MEPILNEELQSWLDGASTAQLLFRENALAGMNACAGKYLVNIRPGMTAERVLGEEAAEYMQSFRSGTMLFPAELSGMIFDAKLSAFQGYLLVELMEPVESLSASALRSIAETMSGPMTAVMALTPKLLPQLEETTDPKNMERAAQVNRGLYALHRAISNLRFASAEEQLSIHPKRVNMTRWLLELTERLEPLCCMAGRKLTVEIPVREFLCDMDQELLERGLMNIISNAMKFTGEGGEIRLTLAKLGGRVRITVRDDGCGIPSYKMSNVFHQKEHRDLIPDPRQGIGLGLPMARRILQVHGGNLLLESEEGKGTAVHLMLPAVQGKGELSLSTTIQRPDYSGGFNKLLLELSDVLPSRAYDTRGVDL